MKVNKIVLMILLFSNSICENVDTFQSTCEKLLTEAKKIDQNFEKASDDSNDKVYEIKLDKVLIEAKVLGENQITGVKVRLDLPKIELSEALIMPMNDIDSQMTHFSSSLKRIVDKANERQQNISSNSISAITERLEKALVVEDSGLVANHFSDKFIQLDYFADKDKLNRKASIYLKSLDSDFIEVSIDFDQESSEFLISPADKEFESQLAKIINILKETKNSRFSDKVILDSAEKELKLMVDESVRDGEVPYTITPRSPEQENLDSTKNKSSFVLKTTASRDPKFEMKVKFYIVPQGLLKSIFYVFSCEFYNHQVVIPIDSDFQGELKAQLSQTNFIVRSILIILNSSIKSKESLVTFTQITEILKKAVEEAAKKRKISDNVKLTPKFNIERESSNTDDEKIKAVPGYKELPLRIEKGPLEVILNKGKDPMSGMIKVKVNEKEIKGKYVQIEFPLQNGFDYTIQLLLFLQDNMFK